MNKYERVAQVLSGRVLSVPVRDSYLTWSEWECPFCEQPNRISGYPLEGIKVRCYVCKKSFTLVVQESPEPKPKL